MKTKTKILTGLAALTLFDIAVAPASAQAPSWAGAYIGAHAGYRWADANFSSPAYTTNPGGGVGPVSFPARNETYHPNGGILGLHGGYNYLLSPNHLLGLEGDFSWGRGKDNQTQRLNLDGTEYLTSEVKLGWQATLRARLGVINGN
jgi:outer membrane immunogenic protein